MENLTNASSLSATYSPEDNKLRLYTLSRLPADLYGRVRAAGFIWAPRQDLFVAPMWTPEREDFLIELCGDIGDEDTTLVDRAEQRAERFEGHEESRRHDAESARQRVAALADNIPLGQPILVGHHSERRARKDAERIRTGMRQAVKMWDTAKYWQARAAGALRHAKYKQRPDVRHRRIKGLESGLRKTIKSLDEAENWIRLWSKLNTPGKDNRPCDDALRMARAKFIANYSHVRLAPSDLHPHGTSIWSALEDGQLTPRAAMLLSLASHGQTIARAKRWQSHYLNRIAYERAMLADAGGLAVDRADIPVQVGGRVRVGSKWFTVTRLNRQEGRLVSVSSNLRGGVIGIELIAEVAAPKPEESAGRQGSSQKGPAV